MSHAESLVWQAYMEKRGSLNLGMRLEGGFALLASMINRALGGHAKPDDYMPHYEAPEASIEDVMKLLASGVKPRG